MFCVSWISCNSVCFSSNSYDVYLIFDLIGGVPVGNGFYLYAAWLIQSGSPVSMVGFHLSNRGLEI